jgi:hypothetical protein
LYSKKGKSDFFEKQIKCPVSFAKRAAVTFSVLSTWVSFVLAMTIKWLYGGLGFRVSKCDPDESQDKKTKKAQYN